jgi:hypothetical protein
MQLEYFFAHDNPLLSQSANYALNKINQDSEGIVSF